MKKEQVLISIFLIAILVLSSGSMVALAKNNTYVVKPNGTDDTAGIQAAFNACGSTPGCTIQLVKGTYYISQIAVYGFKGSLIGMGQGVTIIQALPNLPSPTHDTNADPFYAAPPGPANPWPDLITFVNGAFSVSGFTIEDSYDAPIPGGWVGAFGGPSTALDNAIETTGAQAFASFNHITVLGASGDTPDAIGTNMYNSIGFEGIMLKAGATSVLDYNQITGAFSVTNCVFNYVQTGPLVNYPVGATIMISGNTLVNTAFSISVEDLSSSNVLVSGNTANAVGGASVYGFSALPPGMSPGYEPSKLTVVNNNFEGSEGANAVFLDDPTNTLSAVVSGNTFTTDNSCGCFEEYSPYSSVIFSYSLVNTVASLNKIFGGGTDDTSANGVYITGGPGTVIGNTITGAYTGVWLDSTSGVHIAGNVIKNSAASGLAVTSFNDAGLGTPSPSSNNFIVGNFVHGSGVYDLYWDEATGSANNHWCGNIYTTSSPSVLPSC